MYMSKASFRFVRLELRLPPSLTPQGEPAQPVVEKSFFQKYWIYGVVILGALGESRSLRDSHNTPFISPLRQSYLGAERKRHPKKAVDRDVKVTSYVQLVAYV